MPKVSYNVAPRYTPGSPALVDEATAMHVAEGEKKSYEMLMDPACAGMCPADEALAKQKGLSGIVEARIEFRDGWKVTDVLTGDRFWRGEQKAYRLLRKDRIIRIETYNVTYISITGISISYPRTISRVEASGAHVMIYLDTPGGGEQDRITCNKAAVFRIERDDES